MNRHPRLISFLLTLFVVGVFALYLVGATFRKDLASSDGFDLESLRRVAVLNGGRIQPMDTLARSTLRILSGSEFYEDAEEKSQPAIKWLADAMFVDIRGTTDRKFERSGPVWQARIFRIENEQIVATLGLPTRPGLRYSLSEFLDKREKLEVEVDKVQKLPKEKRTTDQAKLLEFRQHLEEFNKVSQMAFAHIPPSTPGGQWSSLFDKKKALFENSEWREKAQSTARERIWKRHQLDNDLLKKMPPDRLEALTREMQGEVEVELEAALAVDEEAKHWLDLRSAYRAGNKEKFNALVAGMAAPPTNIPAKDVSKTRVEVLFNKFAPFYKCSVMYVFVMVLSLMGLLLFAFNPSWSRYTRWPALGMAALAFLVHTGGIATRIYLQGRPPVTNLYSSAIFIGWGAILTCMVVELVYSYGMGTLVGGFIGFGTCVIAHFLSQNAGDTMEMLQAVLDTNIWLATHVVLVTFGYVATYVAGIFAIAFIVLGLCTPLLDREFFKAMSNIIYGVVCFATMLSFVGTVLGGIWADQSWGRFWGWDPKENGAVLVVIWNSIILHARWGGLVQQRGIAALAVLGNIVVTWSWFGTNMLGVGLHAYGFSPYGYWTFVGSLVVCIPLAALAMIVPARFWMSFGGRYDPPVAGASVKPPKSLQPV